MRSGLPRKFGVLIVSVRRTISGTVGAPVVPVELGLAQLFQTKPQGPIYRPMRLGRCGWERLACPLPSPAMVKEESLRGDSDPWVSSWGSRVVPKACLKEGLQGSPCGLPIQPLARPRAEMKPAPSLFSLG